MTSKVTSDIQLDTTIIVAEDDAVMRTFIAESLERDGYKVLSFESGEALSEWIDCLAVGNLHCGVRHVLVSDIFMPGASALELLERHSIKLGSFRVILITGFGTKNLHEKASRIGADAVIDKPFDMKALKNAIEHQLQMFNP